jgi:hypothetical protein
MSSSSLTDVIPSLSSSIVHDETSNQSIEIPDPPDLSVTSMSTVTHPVTSSDSDNDDAVPVNLTFDWLDEQMRAGVDLHRLLTRFLPSLPNDLPQSALFEILMDLFLPIRERHLLDQYQTLDHAVQLIRTCKNILVLTGAGISVSCGSKFVFYYFVLVHVDVLQFLIFVHVMASMLVYEKNFLNYLIHSRCLTSNISHKIHDHFFVSLKKSGLASINHRWPIISLLNLNVANNYYATIRKISIHWNISAQYNG